MAATNKVHGKDVRTYVAGTDLTEHLDDVGTSRTVATASRPRMGASRIGRLIGQRDATVTLAGLLPETETSIIEHLAEQDGGYVTIVYGTSGRGVTGKVHASSSEYGTAQSDRGTVGSTLQITGGLHAIDVLVNPEDRAHPASSPVTFGSVDYGAARTNQTAELIVVVSAYALTGANHGITVLAQQATASSFTTATQLATTSKLVRTGFYRLSVAGNVSRYVRAQVSVVGTGRYTLLAGVRVSAQ